MTQVCFDPVLVLSVMGLVLDVIQFTLLLAFFYILLRNVRRFRKAVEPLHMPHRPLDFGRFEPDPSFRYPPADSADGGNNRGDAV